MNNDTRKFGQYVLVNASASYALTDKVKLAMELKNVFDRDYEYVWLNTESMHSPGDGRAVYGSVQVDF